MANDTNTQALSHRHARHTYALTRTKTANNTKNASACATMLRMRLFNTSLRTENDLLKITVKSLVAENINLTARNALLELTLESGQRAAFAFPAIVKKKGKTSQ